MAQTTLARLYLTGTVIAKDEREAARLLRLAVDQGVSAAQSDLGAMYAMGLGGLPSDDREALRLFRLAADRGNALRQRNLGVMYSEGLARFADGQARGGSALEARGSTGRCRSATGVDAPRGEVVSVR